MNKLAEFFSSFKKHILLTLALTGFFTALNLLFAKAFFTDGSDIIDTDGTYLIVTLLMLAGVFIALVCMTPVFYETESAVKSIFTVWFILTCVVSVQMILFIVYNIFSVYFQTPLWELFLRWFSLCVLIFVWTVMYTFIRLVSKNFLNFVICTLTVNFAPSMIAYGIAQIYNASPLLDNVSGNYAMLNPFLCAVAMCWDFAFFIPFVLVCAVLFFVILKLQDKELKGFSLVFSAICSVLISLALGLWFADRVETVGTFAYGGIVVAVSMLSAIVVSLIVFREKIICALIPSALVLVLSVAISAVTPVFIKNSEYILPPKNNVYAAYFRLNSGEKVEVRKDFGRLIDTHKTLLDVIKSGTLPDTERENDTLITNLIDNYNEFSISYITHYGGNIDRSYDNLNDPGFDDFFIQIIQSDEYLEEFSRLRAEDSGVRYYFDGGEKWCPLTEHQVKEIFKTYCEELKNAEKEAFYEWTDVAQFYNVYETDGDNMFIPESFEKTKNLIKTYSDNNKKPNQ